MLLLSWICVLNLQGVFTVIFSYHVYHTERHPTDYKTKAHHCLYYYVINDFFDTHEIEERNSYVDQIIPYCLRPSDNDIDEEDYSANYSVDNFRNTFDELHKQNITAVELYESSVSIDVIERYQMYLLSTSFPSSAQSMVHFCLETEFGDLCQYTFDIDASFSDIVQASFQAKQHFIPIKSDISQSTCYTQVPCNRGPEPICLDWREVCNGVVDCLDGGQDEDQCDELELTECEHNEYRCHNGAQCIHKVFFDDNIFSPECLDGSDENMMPIYWEYCVRDPAFRCEDRTCRRPLEFTCGDGNCIVSPFESTAECDNNRNKQFYNAIFSYENNRLLSYDCWTSLICLTKVKHVYTVDCAEHECWAAWPKACREFIQRSCPAYIRFPTLPIAHEHVYSLYTSNQTTYSTPNYICYDQHRCPFILSSEKINNLTCVSSDKLGLNIDISDWSWLFDSIRRLFFGCPTSFKQDKQIENLPILFHCANSSKYISKHRLLDGMNDCFDSSDELFNESCSLNQPYRLKCTRENTCISAMQVKDTHRDCVMGEDELWSYQRVYADRPPFSLLCDTLPDLEPDSYNETDETNCERWPCANMYTQCDGMWNCANGADEANCSDNALCSPNEHLCISPLTNNLTCLPLVKAGDGTVDCVGGTDERMYCRHAYPNLPLVRYRCWNDSTCVSTKVLCNIWSFEPEITHCPSGDDKLLCEDLSNIDWSKEIMLGFCSSTYSQQLSTSQVLLCNLAEWYEFHDHIYRMPLDLMLHTAVIYPTLTNIQQQQQQQQYRHNQALVAPIQYRQLPNVKTFPDDNIWYCNRGIVFFTTDKSKKRKCLCPPSYYGPRCEFQSQRISLTLQFLKQSEPEWHNVLSFVITLISSNDSQIHFHEQIVYIPSEHCDQNFNLNLLYATRPKDKTQNYTVRIDAFIKNNLEYRASWSLPVRFQFLPVNRLAALLNIPIRVSKFDCSLSCGLHGHCTRYRNTGDAFCRCHTDWSGSLCDVKHKCECAPDALCIGPSVCVCPLNKFGPRCYLPTTLCRPDSCNYHGLCVPYDKLNVEHSLVCLCDEGYGGPDCSLVDTRIDIMFRRDVSISAVAVIHLVTAIGASTPIRITTFKKIPFDQETIVLFVSTPFHLVFIELTNEYYLPVVQNELIPSQNISTEVTFSRRCASISEHFNATILQFHLLRRMKYYHILCQQQIKLVCFYDEIHMCLCTRDRHANCFQFDRNTTDYCFDGNNCENNGQCFQNREVCSTATMCICQECYYGNKCQFSTNGFGLSLDALLGYHIKPQMTLYHQSSPVKFSVIVTTSISIFGIISGLLSTSTFLEPNSRKVGCGVYLLASSIVSLLTMVVFAVKVSLLIVSQNGCINNRVFLRLHCVSIDYIIRVLLTTGDWLNACVAVERVMSIVKGTSFDKKKSKQIAKRMILVVFLLTTLTTLQDPLHRRLMEDHEEQRIWCFVRYPSSLQSFDSAMNVFHFIGSFAINFISSIFVIVIAAQSRSKIQINQRYTQHLRVHFYKHKHLLISQCILVILAVPRLVISVAFGCMKSARDPWLFLSGYFVSFIPPTLIFFIFVLPSRIYRHEFKTRMKQLKKTICRYFSSDRTTN